MPKGRFYDYVPATAPKVSFYLTPQRRAQMFASDESTRKVGGMKIYALTNLGRNVVKNSSASAEDMKILEYLWNNKTATDDDLDIVGDRGRVRHLVPKFIKEL